MFRFLQILLILSCSWISAAADVQPGDACTAGQNGMYRLSGGPELSNIGHLVICNGTTWNKVMSFNTTGTLAPKFVGSCSNGDTLTYDSATGGISCSIPCSDNTPNGFSFTDNLTATASTVTTSNIVQITGINCQVTVSLTGEGTPQLRTCSDAACSTVLQDWTSSVSFISNNEYIQLRLTSSSVGGDIYSASITIGSAVDVWDVAPTGDCTVANPIVGTVCADGTVYVGKSPDGNLKMYTTRCNYPRTWTGSVCSGPHTQYPWNNGVTPTISLSATSYFDGDGNSAAAVAASNAESPYVSPNICDGLNENGKSDWYLPAQGEVELLITNQASLEDVSNVSSTGLWTSTEQSASTAYYQRSSDPSCNRNRSKAESGYIRCVRK